MLVENRYPADIRVRNEAAKLVGAGCRVTVVALAKKGEKRSEQVEGVQVYRLPELTVFRKTADPEAGPLRRMANRITSMVGYMAEYSYFSTACLLAALYVAAKHGFDVIHAHNPPDTLFVVGAFFKPFGKRFVFDHHDLSPELYQARLGLPSDRKGAVYKGLQLCEWLSLRLSDAVIATNRSYRQIQIDRGGVAPERIFVVRNGPNLKRIRPVEPDRELAGGGRSILAYLGYMNPQDGVDYMLRALHELAYRRNRQDFLALAIGTGDSLPDLKRLAQRLKLNGLVRFTGYIPDQDMLRLLSSADICLDPNPSNPLNDHSTWIKVMEYMAVGKPIISFDLKETRFSAGGAAVYAVPNDVSDFARCIEGLMDDPKKREKMGRAGRLRVEQSLCWDKVSLPLLQAYQGLGLTALGPAAGGRSSAGLEAGQNFR